MEKNLNNDFLGNSKYLIDKYCLKDIFFLQISLNSFLEEQGKQATAVATWNNS